VSHLSEKSPSRRYRRTLRFDAHAVVHRSANSLLATEITLRRLDGDMAQQKFDLVRPTPLRHRGTGERRSNGRRAGLDFQWLLFGAFLHDVPHDSLRYAVAPDLARPANAPKHAAFAHASGGKPAIDGALDPIRNGRRPNMPGLPDEIDDGPVVFPSLKMGHIQLYYLFPAQPATQEGSRAVLDPACPLSVSGSGTCQSAFARSVVSQLPRRTPRFFGPLTRLMPARSGLSRPESAASYASRRTAASLPLIVPGAS